MSFFEILTILFVFVFITTEKDIKKLKKLAKKLNKHVKKAKNLQTILQTKINNFTTKTLGLSTNTNKTDKKTNSFVEKDFTTNLIIPKQNQLKPKKNKV